MKTKYTDSLFYQLNSNTRYFNLLFENFFKELNIGISAIEHLSLSIIIDTPNCCQRDLAKILIKDRANAGKIANSLQEKGLIVIELKEKKKRPVKILSVTAQGKELYEKVLEIVEPTIEKIYLEIDKDTIEQTKQTLKKFREVVEKVVKVNI